MPRPTRLGWNSGESTSDARQTWTPPSLPWSASERRPVFLYPLRIDPPDTDRIVQFAAKNRLPSLGLVDQLYIAAGLLLYYTFTRAEQFDRAAALVDRILKGANPAEIPVEQPTKFDLVINLKTAKALGLTIPASLLARADQVIDQ